MRERIIFRIVIYSGLLLFGIILLSITSCSPEKRLARLIHKHPELVKTDTVSRKDTTNIPAIHAEAEVKVNTDLSGVDSVLQEFKGKLLDSIQSLKLNTEVKKYIINRPLIIDTIHAEDNGVKFKIWQDGDKIKWSVDKPAQQLVKDIPITTNNVTVQTLNWWDKNNWWVVIVLIVGVVLFVLLKVFR